MIQKMRTITPELKKLIRQAAVAIETANALYMDSVSEAYKPVHKCAGIGDVDDAIWEHIETGNHDYTADRLAKSIEEGILECWRMDEEEALDNKIAAAKSELESLMKQRAKLK